MATPTSPRREASLFKLALPLWQGFFCLKSCSYINQYVGRQICSDLDLLKNEHIIDTYSTI